MQNKYSLGKVYELVCNISGLRYIGSTCEELLSQRLANHKGCFKRFNNNYKNEKKQNYSTSFLVLEKNNYYINLLELVNASCKDELLSRERHYINTFDCVNKCIPLRTVKEYYRDNIKEITIKKSVSNICECGGRYRTDNRSHHFNSDKHKNFYKNKEKEKEKENEKENEKEKEKVLNKSNSNSIEFVLDFAGNTLKMCKNCNVLIN